VESRTELWLEKKDLQAAAQAYAMACTNGIGEACRAIAERLVARDDPQREAWARRARFYGTPPRSDREVAAEEEQLKAKVADANAKLASQRADESARSRQSWAEAARETSAGLNAMAHGGGDSAMRAAVANEQAKIDAEKAAADPTNERAATTARESSAIAARGRELECRACVAQAKALQATCAKPSSSDCVCAEISLYTCFAASSECGKDPKAARAEADRLKREAHGMLPAGMECK
jgi:hypothetical protein